MSQSELVEIDWATRRVNLEVRWIGAGGPATPLIVFLHEGLGSVSMWRDFPLQVCAATGARGLVYSRPGYGRSTPRAAGEAWDLDFMHRQAHEVLPALLDRLGVDATETPLWLFGHSDGASIALLYAAHFASHPKRRPAGVIAMAPHILVEPLSIASIREAREAYLRTDLRERLARHHDDVDSAFYGWNDVWLSPGFPGWQITLELKHIAAPVLAVQGEDDVYGTMAQIDGIAAAVPKTSLLKLPHCGHSPQRDQPEAVIRAVAGFMQAAVPPAEEPDIPTLPS